jgi:uncharacterized protein (DUF305 family)
MVTEQPAGVQDRPDVVGRLRSFSWSWVPAAASGFLGVLVVAGAVILWQAWPRTPGDGSADANFLRDMVVHHDQAVTMALIMRDRTDDSLLDTISTDILLTQLGQVGMMRGWLDQWNLSLVGKDPHMAWMGHPVEGLMPGMATPEEIEQLRTLPETEAEILFCRLMIRHHSAGIQMAQAAVERVDDAEAKRLAETIIAGQFSEIQYLQEALVARGQAQEPVSAVMESMPGMDMGTPTGG